MRIAVTPRRILLAGWIVFLLYAYPGYLDTASADMLLDSRLLNYVDWHAPVMTRLWTLVGIVVGGPPGMLLLQSGLVLAGAYHLLRRAAPARLAAGLACGVLLFPPVLAIEAIVCPQALFAGLALAGAALLGSPRPRRRIGGLAVLMVAAALHPGATVAVVPLVLAGFAWRPGLRRLPRLAIAAGACVAIAGGAYALERAVVDHVTHRGELDRARYDLRGIARRAPEARPEIAALLARSDEIPADRAALVAGRAAMIRAHAGAFARHRLRHLRLMLHSESRLYTKFTEHPDHAYTTAYRARHSLVQRALIAPVRALSHTPVFRPLVYFLAACGLLGLAIVRRHAWPAAWFASGLIYELTAAVLVFGTDSRLSHWLVVTTVLGAALLWVQLRHGEDGAHGALEVDADRPAVPVE